MSKIRIYIPPKKLTNLIEIKEREAIHKIRDVLRLKKNKKLYIFDGEGKEYLYKIKDAKKFCILIEKEKMEKKVPPPAKRIVLGFPIVREEKVDFILQKGVELGVSGFYPFICCRSIQNKPSPFKIRRWHKIIEEATRQSERLWLPKMYEILSFNDIVEMKFKTKLVATIGGESLKSIREEVGEEVFLIIGPEGDFSPREYSQLKRKGFNPFKLSSHILRTETAAIFAVGLINYFFER